MNFEIETLRERIEMQSKIIISQTGQLATKDAQIATKDALIQTLKTDLGNTQKALGRLRNEVKFKNQTKSQNPVQPKLSRYLRSWYPEHYNEKNEDPPSPH